MTGLRMSGRRTTMIGALLTAIGPISMAVYTPAMPELVHAFELSVRRGQALLDRSVAASVAAEAMPTGALLDRIRGFFHLRG